VTTDRDSIGSNDVATVLIQRASGRRRDKWREYQIIADGRQVGAIGEGQSIALSVTPGDHELFLRIDWARSEKLHFRLGRGEVAEFACSPGGRHGPSVTTGGSTVRARDRFGEAWDLLRHGIFDPKHYVMLERIR
jgi:hypothetical protein